MAYLLVPRISLGVPFGPELISWDTNDLITPFIAAAVLGLALNEVTYMAEIMRSGHPVGGRWPARCRAGARLHALALLLARIVFPQAMRTVLPPGRQPGHRHAQGHLAGQRHRDDGPAVLGADHLQPQLPGRALLLVAVCWYPPPCSRCSRCCSAAGRNHFGRGHGALPAKEVEARGRSRESPFARFALLAGTAAADEAKVSRPGQYSGYSPALYTERVTSSFYFKARDGVRLAMDIAPPGRERQAGGAGLPGGLAALGSAPLATDQKFSGVAQDALADAVRLCGRRGGPARCRCLPSARAALQRPHRAR